MTDIAIYIPSLSGGGAQRVMVTLANAFAKRGYRVDLVLAIADGPYLQDVLPVVRIVDLKAHRVLASLPALVRYLRTERPHAMMSALNYVNVVTVFAHLLAKVPTRLIVSERTDVSGVHAMGGPWLKQAMRLLMRWAYRRADAVIAVSRGAADSLAQEIRLPRERISVVYNPVITQELPAKACALLEHPWLGEDKPPVILAAGRLSAAKDFPTLLRAFAKVRAERECRLVILGEGELRQELEGLTATLGVQDSVQFPGFTDNPYAWMSRVAVFALSSAREGLPNALIEAMACGAPVVSTDCPSGPAEILENGRWGKLVPVGDADALAAAIMELLSSPPEMKAALRAEDFSSDKSADEYLKIIIKPTTPQATTPNELIIEKRN